MTATHPDVITVATGRPVPPDPAPAPPGPVNTHPGPDLGPWDRSQATAARVLAALRSSEKEEA